MNRLNSVTMLASFIAVIILASLAVDTLRQANTQRSWLANDATDAERAKKAFQQTEAWRSHQAGITDTQPLLDHIRLRNSPVVELLANEPQRYSDLQQRQAIEAALQQPDGAILSLLISAGWPVEEYDLFEYLRWVEAGVAPALALLEKHRNLLSDEIDQLLRTVLQTGSLPMAKALQQAGFDLLKLRSSSCCDRYSRRGIRFSISVPRKGLLGGLQSAAKNSEHLDMLRWFINNGVDVNAADSDGKTALMWAASARNFTAITELLAAGADPNKQDTDGRTALMYSVTPAPSYNPWRNQAYFNPVLQRFFNREQFKAMLMAGARTDIADNGGFGAYRWAARYPDVKKRQLHHELLRAAREIEGDRVLQQLLERRKAAQQSASKQP